MKRFPAPWGKSLRIISLLATLLCLGITVVMVWKSDGPFPQLALLPLLILLGAAPFVIRGYSITPDCILVHRSFWDTRLPRSGLQSVRVDPTILWGSLRAFGNGGLFSFTGLFYNKRLGTYRCFVTNPKNTVVLQYRRRNVVVSPHPPEEFIRDLEVPNSTEPCKS